MKMSNSIFWNIIIDISYCKPHFGDYPVKFISYSKFLHTNQWNSNILSENDNQTQLQSVWLKL